MYQLRPPHPALAPYIESYWFVRPEPGPVDIRVDVFVDGRADLILNHRAPYTRSVIGGARQELSASNLDAQRLVPIRIEQRGLVSIVGVRFHLGGLGPFARADLRPYTGTTGDPAAVLGDEVRALDAAVADQDPDGAVPLLDAFFRARLRLDAGRAGFEHALRLLSDSGGRADITTVAQQVGVSPRQVDRWFARHLGIAPKTTGRILRFQSALRSLMRDPGRPLADVAAAAGFFDQAHFVRDFRRMTGGVPRGYRGYYPPTGPHDFAPNVVAFVQGEPGNPV